ncbi:hypothetical protein [Nonomuraea aurantiaca]|uniref:hypothetical protein n=1 Tax=Nonomuraea aurantiaca TaxID=2878562 RepID=UPI001CD9E094|nr:hypothetical protein [Nonomuraea aurantiaca]MCA2220030.1 hypothetical protein [Nonomuraea aurantiaca]
MDEVPDPDDHILWFFPEEKAQHGRGRFGQDHWQVTPGGLDDEIVSRMITLHEAGHMALNSSTAWGGVLQAVLVASRSSPDSRFTALLGKLVGACRLTHEAYATHSSVFDLTRTTGVEPQVLLSGYPGYWEHLGRALAAGSLMPDVDGSSWPYWRAVAVTSALAVCMQTPALEQLVERGITRFHLADVPERHRPDWRFGLLRRTADDLWAGFGAAFAKDAWAEIDGTMAADPLARLPELKLFWSRLRRLAIERVSLHFEALGHPAPRTPEVRELKRRMVELLRTEFSLPITFDTDSELGTFGFFDRERIRPGARPEAVLLPLTEAVEPERLLSGGRPDRHIYVIARRLSDLADRYRLTAGATRDRVIVAVQVRRQRSDGVDVVELYELDDPARLRFLAGLGGDHGVLANVSLACAADDAWRVVWRGPLEESCHVTHVVDLPFTDCVRAWMQSGHRFRYVVQGFSALDGRHVVLAVRIGDEAPLLTLCTPTAGFALSEFIVRAAPSPIEPDSAALGNDPNLVALAAVHLAEEGTIYRSPEP